MSDDKEALRAYIESPRFRADLVEVQRLVRAGDVAAIAAFLNPDPLIRAREALGRADEHIARSEAIDL
jgi:hypothetical protein